jgi:hypothetical protein
MSLSQTPQANYCLLWKPFLWASGLSVPAWLVTTSPILRMSEPPITIVAGPSSLRSICHCHDEITKEVQQIELAQGSR